MRKARTYILLGLCVLVTACLRQRMTGEQVIRLAQQSLRQESGYHAVLDIEVDVLYRLYPLPLSDEGGEQVFVAGGAGETLA